MKACAIAFAAMAAVLLAGCTTMTPEERRAADEETCRSYGFKHRNDAFAECLQRLELDRRAERRAAAAALDWDESVVVYRPVIIRK